MNYQLKEEGHSVSTIARRLNMDRNTITSYSGCVLKPQAYSTTPAAGSCLDACKPYYLQRQIESLPDLSGNRLHLEINDT